LAKDPAAHGAHEIAAAPLEEPGAQGAHAFAAPLAAAVPAAQGLQAAAPAAE
jgi:hypothetical protein